MADDVLFRTAATLLRWLGGREITRSSDRRLVGRRIETVEAFGKHLLIRLDSAEVLHTHLRMTGSWHVYDQGDRWHRPEHQARLVLACGARLAVCFNAPVVELLAPGAQAAHPSLSRLGPDVLAEPLDVEGIRRRAADRPVTTTIGELLLDQTVVAGVANIWRCEALFTQGHHPSTPYLRLSATELDELLGVAARLAKAGLTRAGLARAGLTRAGLTRAGLTQGGREPECTVYRRSGRPCRRCGTAVESHGQGEQARVAYWCPTCQVAR